MKNIKIKNPLNDYNIIYGYDSFTAFLEMFNFPKKVMIITTNELYELYKDCFTNNSFDFCFLKDGETSKSIENYLQIVATLTEEQYDRSSLIIGFGGGVVLDLAGFAASTYKRGINLVFIPTTILSMVDASIGGKNGVNFDGIKNVLGTFYSPNMIISSYDFLKTLSDREFISGLMEILKAGIINDKEIINILLNNDLNTIRNNDFIINELIERAINVKKEIVELDPYEMDTRRLLNLGHTIGHAIEALNIGKITHGEAIALGMVPFLDGKIKEEVLSIIKKFVNVKDIDTNQEALFSLIMEDKKIKDGNLNIVYAKDYEECLIKEITDLEIKEKLNEISFWQ